MSYGQIVNIPDPNFKDALINTSCVDINGDGIGDIDADTNNDNEIQISEAENVIGLIIRELSITSLEGIEMFINLEVLDCGLNEITNLDVTQNSSLIELDCDSMLLNSLNLSQNELLEHLDCGANPILNLDLTNNTNLEILGFSSTLISEIDVSQNTNLILLFCVDSDLINLDLSNNNDLEILWCSNTQLSNLNIHNGNNTNITQMWASDNPNLICIEVDNVEYANNAANWEKDSGTEYSENCILGIENNSALDFIMFPNPTKDLLNFSKKEQIDSFKIFNSQGVLLIESSNSSINVSNLKTGIYFVQVYLRNEYITKKFVKL